MTAEQLMLPRYEVIAFYPFSPFMIGSIIHVDNERKSDLGKSLHLFPNIFKPLQWWEKRKPADMPEYIRFKGVISMRPVVYKVNEWRTVANVDSDMSFDADGYGRCMVKEGDFPATKSEYEHFIQNKERC